MAGKFRKNPTSAFLGGSWELAAAIGVLTLSVPDDGDCQSVDEDWPEDRGHDDENVDWNWVQITEDADERFCLKRYDDESVVALWTAKVKKTNTAPPIQFYEVEFLEVEPDSRSSQVGALVVALATKRAVELGINLVAFDSLDSSVPFYEALHDSGMTKGDFAGWQPKPTNPFHIKNDGIATMCGVADALEVEVHEDEPEE